MSNVSRPGTEPFQGHSGIQFGRFFFRHSESNLYCFVLFHNSLSSKTLLHPEGRRLRSLLCPRSVQDGPGTGSVLGRPVGQTPILQFGLTAQTQDSLSVASAKVAINPINANYTNLCVARITKIGYLCGIQIYGVYCYTLMTDMQSIHVYPAYNYDWYTVMEGIQICDA